MNVFKGKFRVLGPELVHFELRICEQCDTK